MSKILKFIISSLVYGLILVSTIIISLIIFYARELPSYDRLYDYFPPTTTRLYAANDQLISEYAYEHRIFIPFEVIPKKIVNAFLAAEDGNYYKHNGIDFRGIARAFVQNILSINKGKSLVGGSTITQQVVKNFLLSDEKSIKRKIQEAILSFRINATISKDRVLELYLNQIFLGHHAYGIGSAALFYFNKSVEDLNLEEAAMLAALPKAPSKYNPFYDYDKALGRRNWVLNKMFENGFISQKELESALENSIELKSYSFHETIEEDYFAEEVRRTIVDQYGVDALYKNGMSIYTTCQPKLQAIAQEALQRHLTQYAQNTTYKGPITHISITENWPKDLIKQSQIISMPVSTWRLAVVLKITKTLIEVSLINGQVLYITTKSMAWTKKTPEQLFMIGDVIYIEPTTTNDAYCFLRQVPEVNGSVVIMSPDNGKVLALVGGFSYKVSQFNRATQALRQPGSAFKPFVYLSALENGFTPSTIIEDSPIELSQGYNLPTWKPKNYGDNFLGPITLRVALEKSRNIPTIRLAQKLGIKKISETAQKLGIYDKPITELSSSLGTIDTTLLKLTNAYAIIVNGGHSVEPIFIDRIQDRNGKTVYRSVHGKCDQCDASQHTGDIKDILPPTVTENYERVVDAQSAYQLISILNGVSKRGTGKKISVPGITIGGKTGTTNDSKDAWYIGFTPDLVIGVFVGFDQPKTLGNKVTGATLAVPIFNDIAQKILVNSQDKEFKLVPGINLYKVDITNGRLINEYTEAINIIEEAFKEGSAPLEHEVLTTYQAERSYVKDDHEMKKLLQELELNVDTGV